jgi:hypothetical protein
MTDHPNRALAEKLAEKVCKDLALADLMLADDVSEAEDGIVPAILAAFDDVTRPLRDIAGRVVLAPCSRCRSDWPHFSVLSTSPVCESCRRTELSAERERREQAERERDAVVKESRRAQQKLEHRTLTLGAAERERDELRKQAQLYIDQREMTLVGKREAEAECARLRIALENVFSVSSLAQARLDARKALTLIAQARLGARTSGEEVSHGDQADTLRVHRRDDDL